MIIRPQLRYNLQEMLGLRDLSVVDLAVLRRHAFVLILHDVSRSGAAKMKVVRLTTDGHMDVIVSKPVDDSMRHPSAIGVHEAAVIIGFNNGSIEWHGKDGPKTYPIIIPGTVTSLCVAGELVYAATYTGAFCYHNKTKETYQIFDTRPYPALRFVHKPVIVASPSSVFLTWFGAPMRIVGSEQGALVILKYTPRGGVTQAIIPLPPLSEEEIAIIEVVKQVVMKIWNKSGKQPPPEAMEIGPSLVSGFAFLRDQNRLVVTLGPFGMYQHTQLIVMVDSDLHNYDFHHLSILRGEHIGKLGVTDEGWIFGEITQRPGDIVVAKHH